MDSKKDFLEFFREIVELVDKCGKISNDKKVIQKMEIALQIIRNTNDEKLCHEIYTIIIFVLGYCLNLSSIQANNLASLRKQMQISDIIKSYNFNFIDNINDYIIQNFGNLESFVFNGAPVEWNSGQEKKVFFIIPTRAFLNFYIVGSLTGISGEIDETMNIVDQIEELVKQNKLFIQFLPKNPIILLEQRRFYRGSFQFVFSDIKNNINNILGKLGIVGPYPKEERYVEIGINIDEINKKMKEHNNFNYSIEIKNPTFIDRLIEYPFCPIRINGWGRTIDITNNGKCGVKEGIFRLPNKNEYIQISLEKDECVFIKDKDSYCHNSEMFNSKIFCLKEIGSVKIPEIDTAHICDYIKNTLEDIKLNSFLYSTSEEVLDHDL